MDGDYIYLSDNIGKNRNFAQPVFNQFSLGYWLERIDQFYEKFLVNVTWPLKTYLLLVFNYIYIILQQPNKFRPFVRNKKI